MRFLFLYLLAGLASGVVFLTALEIRRRASGERISLLYRVSALVFGVYLAFLFAVTISPALTGAQAGGGVNLIPFRGIQKARYNPRGVWGSIVLYVPFGLFLVFLSNRCRSLPVTLLAGAGLSLLIELAQLAGGAQADINDVLLGAAGTLLGFAAGRAALLLPSLRRKTGVLIWQDGKYFRKRHDAGRLAGLALLVLASVLVIGFATMNTAEQAINPQTQTPDDTVSAIWPQAEQTPGFTATASPAETGGAPVTTPSPAESPTQPAPATSAQKAARMISADIEAKNAYVLCLSDDTALYEKDADAQVAPASTTKMLTAITALDFCGPDDAVTVGEEIERMASDASRAYLNQGDRLYVRQLLVAMLLPSGNDAAYSLAVFTGRKIAGDLSLSIDDALSLFYDAMNAKAEAVGAAHSHFLSPDGYDADGQYTTAYDLACIAREFMKSGLLSGIVSRRRISDVWLGGREVTYYSTNELLNPEGAYYYENATGIKTGSNGQAGQCLVSSAEMDGALYVCVVMGSTEEARWTDSIALFEAARNR